MSDPCPLAWPDAPFAPHFVVAAEPLCRALLVADDALLGRALRRVLRLYGIDLTPVPSAEAALRLVAAEPAFDAIVADLGRPSLGGQELARRLRGPRLIALSGHPMTPRALRYFDTRLHKPCAPLLLAAAIRG